MGKRYVVPLGRAKGITARGFGVGSEFVDRGTVMIVTADGVPFPQGEDNCSISKLRRGWLLTANRNLMRRLRGEVYSAARASRC